MNLRDIAAALKAKYRPVFRGGIESEVRAMRILSDDMRKDADAWGAERALTALTEGKGE